MRRNYVFQTMNWQGREVDHSPPSTAEVKNTWSHSFTPLCVFMVWRLIKHTICKIMNWRGNGTEL